MAGRTTLNVSLTSRLSEFVATTVASGRYLSASEVVREGLRLLEERETLRRSNLEEAVPAGRGRRAARIFSPRLAHPAQASDFKKEVLEMPPDADV